MPFNGSGGTSQPASSIYPATASTLIESAKFNISIADIYSMLGSCIVKDGQTTTTARITFASGISTDTVTEKTADTGVTLDSVLLKDGMVKATAILDANSNESIKIAATGSAVNEVTITNAATGNRPRVGATGDDTNIGLALRPKGTGAGASVILEDGNGNEVLIAGIATASAVNEITVTNAATGGAPVISATGGDTNIPLRLSPKGTGDVQITDGTDTTKVVAFEVSALTTATTRTITVPDANVTLGLGAATGVAQTFLGSDVNLNNTANYFNVVDTGSIGASGQKWLIRAAVCLTDTGASANFLVRIWDGSSTVYVESETTTAAAGHFALATVEAIVSLSAATTFHLSCKDPTNTTGVAKTTAGAGTANKATWITAIRLV